MKKILLASLLLFFGFCVSAQETGQKYTSKLGKFSMTSFGEVTEDVRQEKTSTIYRAAFRNQQMLFAISGSLQQNKPKRTSDLLKASVLNFKTALKGKIIQKKNIKENKNKGIYASLMISNGVMVEYKVFYKGLHLYQIMAFAKKENYKKDVADAFFKSFEISK